MAIIVEAVESNPVPMGKYLAVVESVEQDTNSLYGDQIRWTFRIVDGEYANRKMLAWSAYRQQATDRSKLYRWYTILTGITPTGKFDLESVIGKRCLILVKEQTRADGSVISKVDDLQPLPNRATKLVKQPVATDGEETSDPFA